ncbi:MAG TPA: PAC2 family protein, partial [Nitrososphaerales archaeon]|nr:PAC2 family protein [Nitrososphaerales archaeon]
MSSEELQAVIRKTAKGEPDQLAGGVVIEGFPESGLAGTIASSCLVSSLKLAMVGEMSSDYFPPLATVLNGELQAPARIYADARRNIAIFMGDFSPGLLASNLLSKAIVEWAKAKKAAFVLTSFSTPMTEGVDEHVVSAVASGPEAKEIAGKASIPLAELAAVGGVAGRLLLEGREAGVPVLALLIKTHKGMQDYESGLKLAEAIMKIVPSAYCNLEAIKEESIRR